LLKLLSEIGNEYFFELDHFPLLPQQSQMDVLIVPAITGAASFLLSKFFGIEGTTVLLGTTLSRPTANAAVAAAGAVLARIAKDWVIEKIPATPQEHGLLQLAVPIALTGGSVLIAENLLNSEGYMFGERSQSKMGVAFFGAAAYGIADRIDTMFLQHTRV
jgi:hypothetical protein